jgi:hypothetical protein
MSATQPEDFHPEDSPETPSPAEPIPQEPVSDDPFLSGAYRRILRITIILSVIASMAATIISHQAGLGTAAGAFIASLSFIWLHQGADLLVRRMLPAAAKRSKFWILLSFPARYFVVFAVSYVILRGYPGMRVGFIVGLVLPVLAMMCEAAYEAFQ